MVTTVVFVIYGDLLLWVALGIIGNGDGHWALLLLARQPPLIVVGLRHRDEPPLAASTVLFIVGSCSAGCASPYWMVLLRIAPLWLAVQLPGHHLRARPPDPRPGSPDPTAPGRPSTPNASAVTRRSRRRPPTPGFRSPVAPVRVDRWPVDPIVAQRLWAQPEVTGLGRLPMRPPLVPFPDPDLARIARSRALAVVPLARRRLALPAGQQARGGARRLAPAPLRRPAVAHDRRARAAGPCRTSATARSTRTSQMPFAGEPPTVPDDNPTGLYRTTFALPASWTGRRVVLQVGGAESVLYAVVNGDARRHEQGLPARRRVRPDAAPRRAGTNVLAAMVVRWSDATWIEDQDHWFHGGLHRDGRPVLDRAHPPGRRGRHGRPRRRATARGTLRGRRRARRAAACPRAGRSRRWSRRSADEPLLEPLDGDVPPSDEHLADELVGAYVCRGPVAHLEAEVPDVDPWSAEVPQPLPAPRQPASTPTERSVEVTAQCVGFRRVEIRDRQLLINGERVLIRGVNRHDHDPDAGQDRQSRVDARATSC